MIERIFFLSSLAHVALAAQPRAPDPIAAPLRVLQWGKLNFLHTSDTHGWHAGHLQEPSYAADWGDYISFAKHLRDRADRDGADLLLVDTGDRIEGNGLYDGSDPRGKYTYDIFKEQDIDLICSGNHELYRKNASEAEFYQTVPNFKDNYIASNLDIVNPETGALEPLAPRFKKFKTKNQGIRITAFGFLFDFTGNANNTVIQKVGDTVKEKWFQDAINDRDVDLFVIIGHAAPRESEFETIFKTIRSENWDIPIQFFGGHTHIRDFKKWDSKSTALESGRYMETIGFLSINGVPGTKPSFARRYIDNNLFSLYHHSNKTKDEFDTEHGINVTNAITAARKELSLDEIHGCAPRNLWMNRSPYPSNHSIHSWLEGNVLPQAVGSTYRNMTGSGQDTNPALILTNTGAIRFDIFAGAFTKDSTYLVSPFTSGFRVLKDVPYSAAKQLLKVLNNGNNIWGAISEQTAGNDILAPLREASLGPSEQIGRRLHGDHLDEDVLGTVEPLVESGQELLNDLELDMPTAQDLPPGYTTSDDAGKDGDDTEHSKIKFYEVPNCIEARIGFDESDDGKDPELVDVIYNAFIQKYVLLSLRFLGQEFEEGDTRAVAKGKPLTDYITDWVQDNWGLAEGEDCDEKIS